MILRDAERAGIARRGAGMLTRNVLFGMNALSLGGFLLMGFAMALHRQRTIGSPLAFSLMGVGTALLLVGFYFGEPATG